MDFIASIGGGGGTRREQLGRAFASLHQRGDTLFAHLYEGLAAINGVTLFGPPPGTPRTPTISFTLRGHGTTDVARYLVGHGVYASNGDFYAKTVADVLGQSTDGFVRAGAACYTTAEEVERLIIGVRDMSRGR